MLDLAEKIVAGLSGLFVLVTLIAYFWVGVPSTTSVTFLPGVEKVSAQAPPKNGAAASELTPEDQALIAKLIEQEVPVIPGRKVAEEVNLIPQQTFEYIRAEANWIPEIKKAKSKVTFVKDRGTKLKVFDIEEDSLFKRLGLRENDVISLVDGKVVEFKQDSATLYQSMLTSAVKRLSAGQTITVTVVRNNQPLNLLFKL